MKKIIKALTVLLVMLMNVTAFTEGGFLTAMVGPVQVQAEEKNVADYTYQVMPLLSPFNQYFFVRTENPDPFSFRFVDENTVYGEDGAAGTISLCYDSWDEEVILFSDVLYEDESTGRVGGGYIFFGNNVDGGELILQDKKIISSSEYKAISETEGEANIGEITETINSSDQGGVGARSFWLTGYYKWENTTVKEVLPKLTDSLDYLVQTYAIKGSFFDNMSAVQEGLDSICLYSGSFVKGEVYRANKYWFLSSSPHVDQSYYIQKPYRRKGNKSLLANEVYPYIWDSYSFPRAMGAVSVKLDPSATWKMNDNYHWLIDVTFNGETRTYGGAGNGSGTGIIEEQILKKYAFDDGTNGFDLAEIQELLNRYSALEAIDDFPHEDDLTWGQVLDQVGEAGAWIRLCALYSVFGSSDTGYTYLYRDPDSDSYPGYISDGWADGRYIDRYEIWEQGEKFEDHPESSILLTDFSIPQITFDSHYHYNYELSRYEREYSDIKATIKKKTALFSYSDGEWHASYSAFESGCADYDTIKTFVDEGLVDKEYLDMVTLTLDEVKALNVDRNTDNVPPKGYIYDGTTSPGEVYDEAEAHCWDQGKVEKEASCTEEGLKIFTCYVCAETRTEVIPAMGHSIVMDPYTEPTCTSWGYTEGSHCSVCRKVITPQQSLEPLEHKWDAGKVTKSATYTEEGEKLYTCKTCGTTRTELIRMLDRETIEIGTLKLSFTTAVYDGKEKKPVPTVTLDGKTLKKGKDYKVSYKDNVYSGIAAVTVTGIGKYTGSLTKKYKILPAKVIGLKNAEATTTAIKLTWTALTEASYYQIYGSEDGKTYKRVRTVIANTVIVKKVVGKTLSPGTTYFFKVRALDSTKKSTGAYSAVLKTGTLTTAPKITKLTSTKAKTVTVTYRKVTGAKGYYIYKSTDNKKWTKVGGTAKTTANLTKLTSRKTIYVKVIAVNQYNMGSIASAVRSVMVK